MFGSNLLPNLGEVVAMILFGIGFANLLLQKNLIKKIIGLNIMDTAVYLFLAIKGYIEGRTAPIVVDGVQEVENLTVNGEKESIEAEFDRYFSLKELVIHVEQ